MKKLLLGCFLAANMCMLTSCLDSGSGERSFGFYGVVAIESPTYVPLFYYSDYYAYPAYFSNFTTMNEGDCYYASMLIKDEDNPNAATTGYEIATLNGYEVVSKGTTESIKSDTSTINTNELAAGAVEVMNYVKRHLFIGSTHENMGEKQENYIELTFDYDQEPETDTNNRDVYNLFYRVKKTKDGSSPYTTKGEVRAFNLYTYFDSTISNKEKAKGKDRFYFKINYIKSFNSDTTVATWGSSEVYEIPIVSDSSN